MPPPRAKQSVAASAGVVMLLLLLQRAVQFAREIIFARALGPEQFGIYALAFFLIPLGAVVAGLGIPSVMGRMIPGYEERGAMSYFLRRTYTLTVVLAMAVAASIVLAPGTFSRLLYGDPTHIKVMTIAGFAVPLMLVFRNISSTYLGLRLFQASSVFEFFQVAVYAALGAVLVLLLSSATSAVFAYAVSFLLAMAIFVPLLANVMARREPHSRALSDEGFYSRLLGASLWFVVTPVLAQVFHYVDRLCLERLMSTPHQGVYSATLAVAALVSALGLAVSNMVYPHLGAAWDGGRRAEVLRALDIGMRAIGIFLLVLGAVLVLLGERILGLFLGDAYTAGAGALPYLVVFYLFTVAVWLLGVFPGLIRKTRVAAIGLAIALPLNIALNLALIPARGAAGAAMATMLSYTGMWVAVVVICRRLGFRIGARALIVGLLPFTLLLPGLWPGAAAGLAAILALVTPVILTREERALAAGGVWRFIRSLRGGHGGPAGPGRDGEGGEGPGTGLQSRLRHHGGGLAHK